MSVLMTIKNEKELDNIKEQLTKIFQIIETYRVIIEAYVSNFYVEDHWSNIPLSWRQYLGQLKFSHLSYLLTGQPWCQPTVQCGISPLSLLALKSCCQYLMLKRQMVNLDDYHLEAGIEQALLHAESATDAFLFRDNFAATGTANVVESMSKPLGFKNGELMDLEHVFRRHVKPKKQHEIQQLGKVIHLISRLCSCGHVVDVGAGLGHLSRLLTFGYGLKVTTVEAASDHAPKASEFDSEMKKNVQKKLKKYSDACIQADLPDHVVCTVQPDITAADFVHLVTCLHFPEERKKHRSTSLVIQNDTVIVDQKSNNVKTTSEIVGLLEGNIVATEYVMDEGKGSSAFKNLHTCSCYLLSHNNSECKKIKAVSLETASSCSCLGPLEQTALLEINQQQILYDLQSDQMSGHMDDESCTNGHWLSVSRKNTFPKTGDAIHAPGHCNRGTKPDLCCSYFTGGASDQDGPNKENIDSICRLGHSKLEGQLLLAGLHACGDLTPTLLRVFVKCPSVSGLVSVGCCYMKLTHTVSETGNSQKVDNGYPMSEFVHSLPSHCLTYETRELSCHFADAYAVRLQENSPHLKIHSYRAAVQHIITKIKPDFVTGSTRLVVKRGSNMPFMQYAAQCLLRLGVDPAEVPDELKKQAEALTVNWQDVVVFYTLRLSLAPLIETAILLDRMLYLYEQGFSSVLLPVFDCALSPRNFALIASKKELASARNSTSNS